MDGFLKLIVDILSQPAILVALIALIGLLAQRKNLPDTLKGTTKTFVGFLVISAGAGILSGALAPFGEMFQQAFNVSGVVPNNEAIVAIALTEYGSSTALIMFFGMVFNVFIARFTPFKYIFLTGHHTLYMACMLAVIFSVAGFTSFWLILTAGLALGLIMTLSPAIVQPFVQKVTGNNNVALGHFSAVGYAASGIVGKLVKGKNSRSTENINFPKGLGFLRDSTVSIALTMVVIYLIVALFAGPTYIEENLSDGTNYLVFSLIQAGTFAAGVFVILAGVRLVLAEIVPAFKGISQKLVPNAKPALDVPIIYTYAPNAVLIGFFSSFAGGLVSLLIMGLTGTVMILPGVVPHFFTGAAAGVIGNATGGLRGSVAGSFVNGLIISFLPLFLLPVLGDLGFANSTFSDTDFGVSGIFFGTLANYAGQIGIVVSLVVILAVMIGLNFKGTKNVIKQEPLKEEK
ncbi:PTS ascorbate transporter subunit IIC [Peribacillus psychrosaccharolyticus]|uniref:Ascorbate-specific PTS system EIIC component n=1 Tax=Peribacillus psychrosaccharolyticus TaxID=1407 RepID=A0A974NN21_PERPY|nr:PTS ascorbate transporter subunit IIC [Peribacillus psychrosaccharolyticus]MEC2056125.1 PTS ascorbate transporter subunit IIC [Peribacillus psychrosaccharolyticus]MED3745566.1 PTS ascorbate transporter subunit IIC [Peribacillus psychrosaccharolyticus]QQT00682.1 PTS ascorbate transporter subunit IIC [Peribacillus psychrosaccharolyticus]